MLPWEKKLAVKDCPFCKLDKTKNRVIFETNNFTFIEHGDAPTRHHCLLFYHGHIIEEYQIDRFMGNEYIHALTKAYEYMREKTGKEPFSFINPAHQRTIQHFHRHFFPGVFKPEEIDMAVRKLYEQYGTQSS